MHKMCTCRCGRRAHPHAMHMTVRAGLQTASNAPCSSPECLICLSSSAHARPQHFWRAICVFPFPDLHLITSDLPKCSHFRVIPGRLPAVIRHFHT